ncbi:polysaccharide lyase [Aspergillus karnatakaensis]|uniref:polysaccharide lyase family 20 protein n=1 Tax=Aspergillus karnatakaensis TaxID=1810916 RepID=UPI003CCCF88A
MYSKSLSLAALAALLLPTNASQIFSNTGTTSGWDATNQEHNGKVEQVSNVVYEGSSAIKVTQTYDSNYTGRYHSEVVKDNVYSRGDVGFYGFAFRLQEDWDFTSQSYNLAQFIADFNDSGCEDWMPSTMIWLEGDQLFSRVKTGSICNQGTDTFSNLGSVTAGEWHRIVLHVNWQSDGSGFFKIWLDGEKLYEADGISTTIDHARAFQFRVGLYANAWHDDGYLEGSQGTRQIWYDEIAAGTTFADADPDQW